MHISVQSKSGRKILCFVVKTYLGMKKNKTTKIHIETEIIDVNSRSQLENTFYGQNRSWGGEKSLKPPRQCRS